MSAPLRPMSLGEILDRTFQICRSRFLVFAGIGLASPLTSLAVLVLSQVGAATTLSTPTKEMFRSVASWMPRDWPASFIHYLGWPVVAYLTSHELLGESAMLGFAAGWCKLRWRSWVAISAILWAVCGLLPNGFQRLLWASGVESWVGLHQGYGFRSSTGAPFLGLLKWCINSTLVISVALSAPAWAVEQLGTFQSLRRGWTLAKSSWIRILTAQLLRDLLAWILAGSLTLILLVVLFFALRSSAGEDSSYQIRQNFILIAAPAVWALVGAIVPIAFTLIYYDQRIRKEGFDIERMMDAAALNATTGLAAGDGHMAVAGPEEDQA